MATAGSIVVSLEASTAQFVSNIEKGGHALHKFGEQSKETQGLLGSLTSKFGEGVGIGVGIEAVSMAVDLVKEAISKTIEVVVEGIKTLAEWDRQATETAIRTLRVATSFGYATETISGLEHAGTRLGLSAETVDSGLEKMVKTLGVASVKGGEAGKELAQFGLNINRLVRMKPDEALRVIADRVRSLPTPFQQSALAVAAFGKSGQEMLPILRRGSAGIDELIEKQKKLGVARSPFELAELMAADEAIKDIEDAFEGLKNQIAIELAPWIRVIANAIKNLTPDIRTFGVAFEAAMETGVRNGAYVVDMLAKVASWILRINAESLSLTATMERLAIITGGAIAALAFLASPDDLDKAADAMNKLADALGNSDLEGKASDIIKKMHDELKKAADDLLKEMGPNGVGGVGAFGKHEKIPATERRFTFDIPTELKNDPQKQLVQQGERSLSFQQQSTNYLAQLYNLAFTNSTTAVSTDTVFDFA